MRVVLNEQSLIGRLRRRNLDLQAALDNLRATTHRLSQTEELTRTDELTGLGNRRGFHLHLQQRRHDRRCMPGRGLLLIDCDRFKNINDDHGHLVGDRVLQGVGQHPAFGGRARRHRVPLRRRRVLPAGQGRAQVTISNRWRNSCSATAHGLLALQPSPPQITTLSVGASLATPAQGWDDWYALADAALYRAKRLGGNRVEWQDDALAPA